MATLDQTQEMDRSGVSGRLLRLAQELGDTSSRDENAVAGATARVTALAPTGEELAALMSDRNPFVRSGAARWMRHLSQVSQTAIDALRAAVYDQNPYVVQAALGSAGILKIESVRTDARNCLDDSNPCVIHAAIFALGKLGPSEMGELLLPFLDSDEQHVQVAAITAIGQLNYQPAIPLLIRRLEAVCELLTRHRSQLNVATRFLHTLVALEAREAIPLFIRIARDEVGLRGLAVQGLIELRAEEAAPALLPMLSQLLDSQHEEKLCCRLLYLMTVVDYRFAMPTVRAFLGHRQPGIRCAALKAVASWKDRDALDDIRLIASADVSAFVRPAAVTALADIGSTDVLEELDRLGSDANALVRVSVAEALGRLVPLPDQARATLTRLVRDEALAVARAAQEALLTQPVQVPTPPAVGSALPASLREQASAARAYLRRWQSERPSPEVADALQILLSVLD
ncbi:MAG: hypothetical protein EBV06_08330 [Planctomycetia bacterium]|nr:hypothetical protein [Planctomycetia bacterium]